jgi:hypothetical protein
MVHPDEPVIERTLPVSQELRKRANLVSNGNFLEIRSFKIGIVDVEDLL